MPLECCQQTKLFFSRGEDCYKRNTSDYGLCHTQASISLFAVANILHGRLFYITIPPSLVICAILLSSAKLYAFSDLLAL